MTIKTTVKQEKEIEIELPFFRNNSGSNCIHLYAVLDEKTVITVFHGAGRTAVSIDVVDGREGSVAEIYQNWSPITEQEFLMFHAECLKQMSLEPQLT